MREKKISKNVLQHLIMLLVLSATMGFTFAASFATASGALVEVTNVSISLVFSFGSGIVKMFLKTMRQQMRSKCNKFILLTISKLNSIEIISKALTHAEINHEEFVLIDNKGEIFS